MCDLVWQYCLRTFCSGVLFRGSAAVAQLTVNQLVAGSNPAPGATKRRVYLGSFFRCTEVKDPNGKNNQIFVILPSCLRYNFHRICVEVEVEVEVEDYSFISKPSKPSSTDPALTKSSTSAPSPQPNKQQMRSKLITSRTQQDVYLV